MATEKFTQKNPKRDFAAYGKHEERTEIDPRGLKGSRWEEGRKCDPDQKHKPFSGLKGRGRKKTIELHFEGKEREEKYNRNDL